ncbi:MAG: GAF domain-containing protein [Anaerolineae bacterium]
MHEITERKQAEEEIRQRTAQLEALREGRLELTTQLDLDTLLHSIASRAFTLLGGTLGTVYLYRPEQDVLELSVAAGHNQPPTGIVLHRGEGLAGKVLETGEPLIVDDYRHWEGRATIYDDYSFAAIVSVPARWGQPGAKEEFLGVLDVHAVPPRTFSPADVELLSLFATQAATAIRNVRIIQAEQEQRELAKALEEAAAAVSSTLDLDEVLDRILEQVERVVSGDVFNVMLVEENHARAVRWRGYERFGTDVEEFISTVAFPIPETPTLQQMVETGKPIIIPDTGAAPNWVALPPLEWLRSYVAAPIQVTGLTIGFLNVDGARPGQFGPTDARRLEAFASHAATAIENAQLYQRLQAHAGQLEQRVQERTAELQAQYAWLDAILRSTTDGIVVTNEEGSIVQANPVAQTWLTRTLSPEEASRLREAVQSVARQACAEETGFSGKHRVSLLELTGLDLELNAALVVEEGGAGKPTAAVVDIHDVTHLKALDRMKTRFITNISHELRTPVAAIKLYTYLMRQHPEKWEQYLDTLAHEADHQAGLVEGILEISRIDAGRMEMEPRPTSLNELTEAVVARHHVLAEERGLTLEHRPETRFFGKDPVSLVDPERMMQVLNNLVGNGIRYTLEGGTVVVSTGTEEAEGRTWATVTVADTGMGIPEDELPHVFDRFFRGAEPRAMQLTGTGLGLAIAKEIVELHGGYVTVESPATALRAGEEGVGSAFTVWLPLIDQSRPDRFL